MDTILNIAFDFEYFPLLIVVGVAWAVPMLMTALRLQKLPTVIMEIIAGYLIGHFIIGFASDESIRILDFLALTGFIFLMFLSGLEIDVDQIIFSLPRRRLTWQRFQRNPFLVGITYFLITLFLSFLGTLVLSTLIDINNVWYFSIIMVTTSVGIIFPVLKNRGETSTNYGQMMILAAAIADIVSIILFSFSSFIIRNGFQPEVLYIVGIFFIFYLAYYIGKKLNIMLFRRISFQLAHAASQISIRGTLLLILIFIVASQFIGEEIILLGAFLGGLLLSMFLHKDRSLLIIKLDGMGFGFFIPVFFIMVGVEFDEKSLLEFDANLIPFLGGLLLLMFLVKVFPSFLWVKLFGWRKAISGGFLMASRLSLIIAASAIGLELGVITPGVNASFVLLAVITCLLSPVLYNNLNPVNKSSGEKTIIIGGSSTGVLLMRRLTMHGKRAIIVDHDKKRYEDLKAKGFPSLLGDGLDAELYAEVGLQPDNYVVVETGSDELNLEICKLLRQDLHHEKIISKSGSFSLVRKLESLEVEIIDSTRVLASTIESLILRPSTYHALIGSFENYYIQDIQVTGRQINGLQVKDIAFHHDCTLVLINRGNDKFIPHGDSYIRLGDVITVFGNDSSIDDAKEKLSN